MRIRVEQRLSYRPLDLINSYPDIVKSIKETRDLTADNESALKDVLSDFSAKFMADKS